MEHLLNDKRGKDPDTIKEFAGSIQAPTLVLWGKNDKVRIKACNHPPLLPPHDP